MLQRYLQAATLDLTRDHGKYSASSSSQLLLSWTELYRVAMKPTSLELFYTLTMYHQWWPRWHHW